MTQEKPEPLLEVRHLKKYYPSAHGVVRAVDDVSFHIAPGETLGLVGESGCGKTTAGRLILRLVEPTAGQALLRTRAGRVATTHDIFRLRGRKLRTLRRHMQMVFQDPYGSLNPRLRVGTTLEEGMIAQGLGSRPERRERIGRLLERVGLEPGAAGKYPHAFSGGQRQRIGIARALAVEPDFIVCDEPVSALDVSVQAQIVNLLLDLQRERNLAYLFIAHDLAVVAHVSHRVAVMYAGQIVEMAASEELYREPAHPYTRVLLAAVPGGRGEGARPAPLPARIPLPLTDGRSVVDGAQGCRFKGRCPAAVAECSRAEPELAEVGPGHWARCHLAGSPAGPARRSGPT